MLDDNRPHPDHVWAKGCPCFNCSWVRTLVPVRIVRDNRGNRIRVS